MRMFRKSFAFLCLATFSLGLGLVGCAGNSNGGTKETTFTVTFDSQGGSAVEAQTVKYGEKATKPADPTKANFTFDAWYEDAVAVTKFDFDLPITSDWTVYAGWKAGKDPDPGPGPQPKDEVLYFKDAAWWNKDAAATWYSFDDTEPAAMTYITISGGVSYWKVDLPSTATTVKFYRYGNNTYWGAETNTITLADRGEHNMYDISASSESWKDQSKYAEGVWATYSEPTPTEDYTLNVAIASDFAGTESGKYGNGGAITVIHPYNQTENTWITLSGDSVVIPAKYTHFILVRYNPEKTPATDGWDGKWNQTDEIQIDSNKTTITVTGWGQGDKLTYTYA